MPKKCVTFISGFLIPNLDSEKFGSRLQWTDRSKKQFQMEWYHKGGPFWTEREAEVFVEWDKKKGHFQPSSKTYFTQSKQRFRSLLYKLKLDGQLKELQCEDKSKKFFCIGERKQSKRRLASNYLNAEYGLCNEGDTLENNVLSFEEMEDNEDCSFREQISNDEFTNVLEDHTYTSTENVPNIFTDDRSDPMVSGHFQDVGQFLAFEITPDYFDKRVLAERNCFSNIQIPDATDAIEIKNEDLKYKIENMAISRTSGKLQENPSMHQSKLTSENTILGDIELKSLPYNQTMDLLEFPSTVDVFTT